MTKLLPLTAALLALSTAAPPDKFTFVDLEPHANQKLTDVFGTLDGNDLKSLRKGERTCASVNFKIGSGVVELHSRLLPNKRPNKVEGIKVGKACAKLHILHATEYGNAEEGNSIFVKDGTQIAEYKVRYEDGKTETIPVVYGQDVRDWWFNENSKGVTRGKVAWQGDNDAATGLQCRVRLYLTSWTNPHPDKKIATIDYQKTDMDSAAAPFCAAITLEAK